MQKIILKTSKEAKLERLKRDVDRECPECGKLAIGFGSTRNVNVGLFKSKTQREKSFTCFDCGCEWSTGWKDV